MADIQSLRRKIEVVIASATSLSSAVNLEGYRVLALDLSSGWDAANRMTFRAGESTLAASATGGLPTFFDLYDANLGTEYQIASGNLVSATGRSYILPDELSWAMSAHRYLRIQSGPSSAPVNLTTGVTVGLVLGPMR